MLRRKKLHYKLFQSQCLPLNFNVAAGGPVGEVGTPAQLQSHPGSHLHNIQTKKHRLQPLSSELCFNNQVGTVCFIMVLAKNKKQLCSFVSFFKMPLIKNELLSLICFLELQLMKFCTYLCLFWCLVGLLFDMIMHLCCFDIFKLFPLYVKHFASIEKIKFSTPDILGRARLSLYV